MNALKALALGTVPVVGAFLCILIFQIGNLIDHTTRDEASISSEAIDTLQAVNAPCSPVARGANPKCGLLPQATLAVGEVAATVSAANRTLRAVNQPCVPGPCGTLADINKTLNTARLTMGQIEIAANHEDRNLGVLDAQEVALFADTHKVLSDMDALVASPYIASSLHNLDTSSAALADSTKQADALLTDARQEADKYTHPPKKKLGFWGAVLAGGDAARHFMPPLF